MIFKSGEQLHNWDCIVEAGQNPKKKTTFNSQGHTTGLSQIPPMGA